MSEARKTEAIRLEREISVVRHRILLPPREFGQTIARPTPPALDRPKEVKR